MFSKTYSTARNILTFLTIVGWVVAGIGVIMVLMALAAMGKDTYGPLDMIVMVRGVAGGTYFVLGLLVVGLAQVQFATLDQADISREMLALMRGEAAEATSARAQAPDTPQQPKAAPGSGVWKDDRRDYKGHVIAQQGNHYVVSDQRFSTLGKAKKFIDGLQ